jgi:tetratricopeptide (TPR) repeat protein
VRGESGLVAAAAAVAFLVGAVGLPAQGGGGAPAADAARRAFDLERRGSYTEAAAAYREALAQKPGDASSLFGLERSLGAINRLAEIVPDVQAAIAASPGTGAFYGVALRAWAAADRPDSLRAAAERWAALAPGDEAPYREWGAAALARRDRAEARRAYSTGRERLGRPDALAAEIAAVAVQDQDWATALHEWVLAAGKLPGYRTTAVRTLGTAPEAVRPDVLGLLSQERGAAARRIESDLRARWGDPVGGFKVLEAGLPDDRAQAIEALTGFLDQLRGQAGPAARQAQALALSALAARTPGASGARLRLDAAQAFADAGDPVAARRMLSGVAADSAAPEATAADAATTLVGVLVKEDKVDEAQRKLAELAPTLASEDWLALRRQVAWGWVRTGKLARADSMIAGDSSVDGLALSGRLRLLHGDLTGAVALLKQAGPYAGTREEATARTALLALLQPIEADSLPALGAALLAVERGDTAGGVAALEKVAGTLPNEQGGAEIRLYAGRMARAGGKTGEAERLFRAADVASAKATAPAAELALAGLLLDLERPKEATEVLERMILGFPDSALIPQARRLLDEARGAVPKT